MKVGQLAAAIELGALCIWLGAAIFAAAVVAPAAFAVLPSRTVAGALVGRILPVIFVGGIAAALVAVACEISVAPIAVSIRLTAPLMALAAGCAIAQFVITPRLDRIRVAVGGPIDALDASDPRRAMFGKLHAISVICLGISMLGAVVAIGGHLYAAHRADRVARSSTAVGTT